MNKVMKQACLYYLKNKMSVIPVGKDKKPLINWKEYQNRIATIEEIDQWFKTYPDMQIGIVTGKISRIIVVDIDAPDLDLSWLPKTAIVKTGSGGLHYYYSYVEGCGNKARIKDFIDIRGDGGYVVAPPSSNLKGEYTWVDKIQPVFFPKNLFFKDEKNNVQPVQTEYTGFGEGQRNEQMAKYIGHILAKIHPSEWDTIAYPTIEQANQKNTPPLADQELQSIFRSICSTEKRNDNQRWYQKEEVKEPNGDLVNKTNYTWRYTWGTKKLDNNFSIIKRGNFIVLGASSGSGKTTFAFDMAQKNALIGHKVLFISLEMEEKEIKESLARKKAGITIQEERDYNIPEKKQKIYERKLQDITEMDRLYFRGIRRGGSLKWEDLLKVIYEFKDLDLIFIDNLDLIEAELGEHELDRQKRIVKRIMAFTADKQVPIVLIHHYRKTSSKSNSVANENDLSGSKKIVDGADRLLNISRNRDPEAEYPDKYRSVVYLQKGREYSDAMASIYFIKGTFEDEAPLPDEYEKFIPII